MENGDVYGQGSRLKVAKYVYRLYTKRAVVVGDVGYPSSRSVQGGWGYQLQYKRRKGGSWSQEWVDTDSWSQRNSYMFYRDEYGEEEPEMLSNINTVNFLPTMVVRSNVSEKYHPTVVHTNTYVIVNLFSHKYITTQWRIQILTKLTICFLTNLSPHSGAYKYLRS